MADGKQPERRAFLNQKQLREGAGGQNVTNLSGDGATDDRVSDEGPVQEPHNALQLHRQLGGLFMHPMHDASADPQLEAGEELAPPEENR
ncbi:MAG: hypothetical protein ACOY94_06725 [Bacillota bacterium]